MQEHSWGSCLSSAANSFWHASWMMELLKPVDVRFLSTLLPQLIPRAARS